MNNEIVNSRVASESLTSSIKKIASGIDFDKMERMTGFLEQLPFSAFIKDKENRVLDCNEAFLKLAGLTRLQMLGHGWQKHTTIDEEELAHYLRNDLEVIATGKPKKIFETMASDETIKLLTYKIPFYQKNKIVGIIGFSIDITELLSGGVLWKN